jgi:hypothetical protein
MRANLPFYQHLPGGSPTDAKAARAEKLPIHFRHVPMSRISVAKISAFPHSFMACIETNLSVASPFPNVTELLTLRVNVFLLSEIKIILLNVCKYILISLSILR